MKLRLLILSTLLSVAGYSQSVKISDMPAATTLAGSEIAPIVQSGANKKATIGLIRGWSSIGTDGQLLRVNTGATALEFFTPSYMVYPSAGLAKSTGSAWDTSITDNSADWNTAFGWGDHATAGYLTALTDGNGTTANGTAVDLGGTLMGDVEINGDNTYSLSSYNLSSFQLQSINDSEITSGGNLTFDVTNDILLAQTPPTATLGDILTRNTSTGALEKLGIGSGLSISSGNLVASGGITISTTPITGGASGRLLTSGTTVGELALGTGISTWLGAPSWTNFNSAITGTAPFIKTTGTSSLTGNILVAGSGSNYNFVFGSTGSGEIGSFEILANQIKIDYSSTNATGDTYYRNSSGYFTRLAAGTNGHVLTLAGGIPSWAAPSGLTVGTSTITSGTNTKILYNNSGVLGEYTVSGTGNVALTTSPVFTTPNIGTATGTASGNYSLASGGTATGTNTFAMGSNPFILTSGVTTGTGATAGIQNVFNSLTTGNGLDISSSSVSSGAIVKITGTGTAAASNTQSGLVVAVSGANATSNQSTYGGYFSNTHTGTSSKNIGLYAAASGGTSNFAIFADGNINLNTSQRLTWEANSDKSIWVQANIMTLSTFGDISFKTWGGAAYAERFRVSDTYTAIGGGTTATALRFLEPSGSGTNYSSFSAVAQSANINYSLPPTVGAAGAVLTDAAGNGVLTWEDKSLQSATNTKTEKVIYNVGTIGSAATSTYSIHAESYYANGTTLLAKITVVAVKTDGSASAHSTVTARFRKNSSGTWSVDDAGTDITSDITILADVVGDFTTNPNVKVTMGAASGNYNVSWVAETIEVK